MLGKQTYWFAWRTEHKRVQPSGENKAWLTSKSLHNAGSTRKAKFLYSLITQLDRRPVRLSDILSQAVIMNSRVSVKASWKLNFFCDSTARKLLTRLWSSNVGLQLIRQPFDNASQLESTSNLHNMTAPRHTTAITCRAFKTASPSLHHHPHGCNRSDPRDGGIKRTEKELVLSLERPQRALRNFDSGGLWLL